MKPTRANSRTADAGRTAAIRGRRWGTWPLLTVLTGGAVLFLAALGVANSPAAANAPASTPTMHYVNAGGSAVTVAGTSTLHDWTAKGNAINGDITLYGDWKATKPIDFKSIQVTIPVESLKSSEGGGMDDTMYEALKRKQAPTITYKLTGVRLLAAPSAGHAEYRFDTNGELTVAGATRPISLVLVVVPSGPDHLTISTSATLKMTDFGISPPKAMLGMVKSGNSVNVNATWQLVREPNR